MIKKRKYLLAYLLALSVFSVYVVMDTFVITRVYGEGAGSGKEASIQIENSENGQDAQTQDGQSQDGAEAVSPDDADGGSSETQGHSHGNGGPPSGGPGHGDGSGHGRGKKPGSGRGQSSGSKSSASDSSDSASSDSTGSTEQTSQDTYNDGKVSIEIREYTANGSAVHVAEVSSSSAKYLKTAFAQGSYGKNVTAKTSEIASDVNAILAINGDYYGAREEGYVIRNGELYRSTSAGNEDLVIYSDGSFEVINESEVTAEQLLSKGAVQTLSFGPALIENGSISVDADDEVGRATASNPRTAIGIKSDGSYLFVVSDGRTDESEGLSLLELAQFMKEQGAVTAYNLDGGGSSTMVFNGTIINTPTGGGIGNGSGSERKVSDIVYIGY